MTQSTKVQSPDLRLPHKHAVEGSNDLGYPMHRQMILARLSCSLEPSEPHHAKPNMKINTIKHALCAGLALCAASLANADNPVTFQVDMSTSGYDPSSQTVEVRGNFNNWGNTVGVGGFALTNNPSGPNPNLWTGTTNLPAGAVPAGVSVIAFKYILMPGVTYESSHNRNQTIPSTSGASLVVPPAYFNDAPPAPFTCSVTFQVDMAQQINIGTFIPNTSQVQARGLFNGWGRYSPRPDQRPDYPQDQSIRPGEFQRVCLYLRYRRFSRPDD